MPSKSANVKNEKQYEAPPQGRQGCRQVTLTHR